MATIEPRLIHLLNKSPSPEHHQTSEQHQNLEHSQTSEYLFNNNNNNNNNQLSLPPIDVDNGGYRGDWSSQRQIPSFSSIHDVTDSNTARPVDREPGHRSLDLMLQDPDPYRISYTQSSWNEAIDGKTDRDGANKKRQRNHAVTDDLFHLPNPHPLKKQRSSQQVVPPIINGLYSPPDDANVFPPIQTSTGAFRGATEQSGELGGRSHTRTSGYIEHTPSWSVDPRLCELPREDAGPRIQPAAGLEEQPAPANEAGKKRKVTKPRRPWTEDESTNLLLGVKKHGKGNWTKILADHEFHFDNRKTTDLKDRFRSIFPETISEDLQKDSETRAVSEPIPATRTSLPLDMLLADDKDNSTTSTGTQASSSSNTSTGKRKTGPRSHRMGIENLRKLGIDGPLKESGRKKRILFTEEEDKQILQGLEKHGPQWTLIRNDPKYNLATRRPTDLRDRIRNKYPEVFQKLIDHKHARPRSSLYQTLPTPVLEGPSSSALPVSLEASVSRRTSKEIMDKVDGLSSQLPLPSAGDSSETLPGTSRFDMGTEHTHSTGMDFARLRLNGDDVQSHMGTAHPSMDESPSSRWPSVHPLTYNSDQLGSPSTRPFSTNVRHEAVSSVPGTGHPQLPPHQRSMSPTSRVLDLPNIDQRLGSHGDTADPEPSSFGLGRQQLSLINILQSDELSSDQHTAAPKRP